RILAFTRNPFLLVVMMRCYFIQHRRNSNGFRVFQKNSKQKCDTFAWLRPNLNGDREEMYDLIGDIQGYADELVQLLVALGYEKSHGAYRHPERKVIFLGDFIDRGPKIRQVLEIVRPMIAEGFALAVMGNHELNALAYH